MQVGNDKAAHNASNPNAQKTGDPQANAFRQSGFEQELCRVVGSSKIDRRRRPRPSAAAANCATAPGSPVPGRAAGAAQEQGLAGSMLALLSEAVGGSKR